MKFSLLFLLFFSTVAFAQNSAMDEMKRRMQFHEELHRRMRDKILFGKGGDDTFQDLDKMFNDIMNDGSKFEPRDEFRNASGDFTSEWRSDSLNKILILTPKDQSVQLDINVKDQYITIGSKQESKNQNSQIESSSSTVIPVPYECDGNKVQMKSVGNSIHLIFPFKGTHKINGDQNDRRPIKPTQGDVEI